MKRILSLFLTLVLTAALLSPAAAAANETAGKDSDWLYITLDPGHGGDGAGGVSQMGGYVPSVLAKTIESVKEATGLDIREIMKADTYDAKVTKNVHVTGLEGLKDAGAATSAPQAE